MGELGMNHPVPRRRQPWGAVLSNAPWDGKPIAPEPTRMPNTLAAPLPTSTRAPTSRKRQAFGSLLQATPWAGAPRVAVHVPVHPELTDTLIDFPADDVIAEDTTLETAQ
jgi:hypothetical protein